MEPQSRAGEAGEKNGARKTFPRPILLAGFAGSRLQLHRPCLSSEPARRLGYQYFLSYGAPRARAFGARGAPLIGSLSMHVFETRTATGSELFSLLTCLYTTTFKLLSIFSPLEMISIKIWETPLFWHAKCSLPVAVRVSKTRVLKLPNM